MNDAGEPTVAESTEERLARLERLVEALCAYLVAVGVPQRRIGRDGWVPHDIADPFEVITAQSVRR